MSLQDSETSAVYTALFGDYETLNSAHVDAGDGVPFICFTDDRSLESDFWEIRHVKPLFARDPQRSQREIKIRGHESLTSFSRTFYVDNRITLLKSPNQILDEWLAKHDLAIPLHSFRESVLDEFIAVIDSELDDPARVYEQLYHYSESDPQGLEVRPFWNGIIARRQTPLVTAFSNRWFDEVLRYSRRDQLSINHILANSGVEVNRVSIDNHISEYHVWPEPTVRSITRGQGHSIQVLPNLAKIRRLDVELSELRRTLNIELGDALRSLDNIQASKSWKLTRPFRTIAFWLRRSRLWN